MEGDPFEEYDGVAFDGDPFQEFDGKVIKQPADDPFEEFGGSYIKQPRQFLAEYMASPMYKKRLQEQNIKVVPSGQPIVDTPFTYNNNQDTQATVTKEGKHVINAININKKELADAKKTVKYPINIDDAEAHELSHISRDLTPEEQLLFASKNKSPLGYGLYSQYQADSYFGKYKGQYNNYQTDGSGTHNDPYHDFRPSENKADLDALRYMMQKKGIYDTSKRDMTIDDFNRASKDPEINKSLIFNRLIQQFKPVDIIHFNNAIAMNRPGESEVNDV